MVKDGKKIEKEYAFKICNETKDIIESEGYPIDFIIKGGIISKGYSYNDIDTILIAENPINDEDASKIATLLYANIPEVSHHTILYVNRDNHISCQMGTKPELSNFFEGLVSFSANENNVINSYKRLYKELGYENPILCLKENIGKVVTEKDYEFL